MKKLTSISIAAVVALGAIASPGAAQNRIENVEAGPIWNNRHARRVCPRVAESVGGRWTGHWRTTIRGRMSVCNVNLGPQETEPETQATGAEVFASGEYFRLKTLFRGDNECLEGNRRDSPVRKGSAFMDNCQNVTGQLWRTEPAGNGFYRLKTQFRGDNECLEGNRRDSPVRDGSAFMDSCQNVTGQFWKLEPTSRDGFYRLKTRFRGDNECFEGNRRDSPVRNGSAFMDSCQNVSGQLWEVVPVE